MKNNLCKSIICSLLISLILIGSLKCFVFGRTADEVNTLIGGIVSFETSSKAVKDRQGLVDYYTYDRMTLGGEWYVLSFIQNGDACNYSRYEASLIEYLKNNKIYSATTREKFALILIALNTEDEWAKGYIGQTAEEAIGRQGIMSLVFGLHLLNNGCENSKFTSRSLAKKIIELQNEDGGWANSGTNSDVDVTAMTLQSLYPYYYTFKSNIDKAINLLSSRQNSDGTFQSYGVYNAESTAQTVIALSCLGIDASTDPRFIKNSVSAFDALLSFRNSDGSFSHIEGGSQNNSATSQAFNALVAFSRFIKHQGAFYKLPYAFAGFEINTRQDGSEREKNKTETRQENTSNGQSDVTAPNAGLTENISAEEKEVFSAYGTNTHKNNTEKSTTGERNSDGSEYPSEAATDSNLPVTASQINELITFENGASHASVSLTKSFKLKLCLIGAVLLLAVIAVAALIILDKRNKKNFIVLSVASLIIIVSIIFVKISVPDDYYNSSVIKNNTIGAVSIEVRCDTVKGRETAPKNPVILEKTVVEIEENDTVYDVLSQALQKAGIPFEHNASYYISGIDNLYEFQFGDLSGWMYLVNGQTPSVGCAEYKLSDGDEILWVYTCDIGNDLKQYEKN